MTAGHYVIPDLKRCCDRDHYVWQPLTKREYATSIWERTTDTKWWRQKTLHHALFFI